MLLFDIYKGRNLLLVGESGSGKTTIGRAVIRVNPVFRRRDPVQGVLKFPARFRIPWTGRLSEKHSDGIPGSCRIVK